MPFVSSFITTLIVATTLAISNKFSNIQEAREFRRIAGRESSKSVAIALYLGIIKGTVLINLTERIGVENVQGTRY